MPNDRKMPVRLQEIELKGDYTGWKFTARTNPLMDTLSDLQSGLFNRITGALADVIYGWNFVDEEGEPLADPAEIRRKVHYNGTDEPLPTGEQVALRHQELQGLMGRLPIDLNRAISDAIGEEIMRIPPN